MQKAWVFEGVACVEVLERCVVKFLKFFLEWSRFLANPLMGSSVFAQDPVRGADLRRGLDNV